MNKTISFLGNFIGGRFRKPAGRAHIMTSEDPGDLDTPVGVLAFSDRDVDAAVRAARRAFSPWSALPPERRAVFLKRFGRALRKEAGPLASLITREMGKPIRESCAEIDRIFAKVETAAEYEPALTAPSAHDAGPGLEGICRFRPRGVLAILSPFNVPAHPAASQTLSAVMTGNTVVLKPSELVPFTGQLLARSWQEADLPPGVFNLVQGGACVGARLVAHPDVNGIFFTGSWQTGSRIRASLLDAPQKILALEMGGKNAAIVLDDADFENAIAETLTGAFMTTGQRCNATSRILVQTRIAKKFIPEFTRRARGVTIGYGTDDVLMGPLASRRGHDRFLALARKAGREGFETLLEGGPFKAQKRGYYVRPSVRHREGGPRFAVRESSYADEELLGPDVAIYTVKTIEEAIRLNNRPRYGLVASVFTRSRAGFEKVFRAAENGLIHWNAGTVRSSARLPFGGMKRSGNGRPAGFFSSYICTVPTASIQKSVSR